MALIPQEVGKPQDPNYLGYSHPITQPKGDTSKGELFEGLGKGIKIAAAGLDYSLKEGLETNLRRDLEPLIEEHKKNLEATKQALLGGAPLNVAAPATDDEGNPIGQTPEQLSHLGPELLQLAGARRAGVITQTHLIAAAEAKVKPYRDRFLGHIDHIDKTANAILGFDLANARVRSLTQDINKLLSAAGSQQTRMQRTLDKIRDTGASVYPELQQGARTGRYDNDYLDRALNDLQKGEFESKELERTVKNANNTLAMKDMAGSQWIRLNGDLETRQFYNALLAGTDKNIPPELSQAAADIREGKEVDPVVRANLGLALDRSGEKIKEALYTKALNAGIVTAKGGAKVEQEINESMFVFNRLKELVSGKTPDYSEANRVNFMHNALENRAFAKAMKDPTILDYTLRESVLKKASPTLHQEFIKNWPSSPQAPQVLDAFRNLTFVESGTQGSEGFGGQRPIVTITDSIARAREAGLITNDASAGDVQQKLLKHAQSIANPNVPPEVKLGLISWTFNPTPENLRLVQRISPKDAQIQTFKDLASPQMIKNVYDTATKMQNDAPITQFDTWVDVTHRNLFAEDVKNLNEIARSPNVQIGYNTETGKFSVVDRGLAGGGPAGITDPRMAGYDLQRQQAILKLQRTVDNINNGMEPVINLAKQKGQNVDAIVHSKLTNLGLKLGEGQAELKGFPQKMMEAVEAERLKKVEEQQRKEAEEQRKREEHGKTFRQR